MKNRSHLGAAIVLVSILLTSFSRAQEPAGTGAAPPINIANGSLVCRSQTDGAQPCSADAAVAAKNSKEPVLLAQATASAAAPQNAAAQPATPPPKSPPPPPPLPTPSITAPLFPPP